MSTQTMLFAYCTMKHLVSNIVVGYLLFTPSLSSRLRTFPFLHTVVIQTPNFTAKVDQQSALAGNETSISVNDLEYWYWPTLVVSSDFLALQANITNVTKINGPNSQTEFERTSRGMSYGGPYGASNYGGWGAMSSGRGSGGYRGNDDHTLLLALLLKRRYILEHREQAQQQKGSASNLAPLALMTLLLLALIGRMPTQ